MYLERSSRATRVGSARVLRTRITNLGGTRKKTDRLRIQMERGDTRGSVDKIYRINHA